MYMLVPGIKPRFNGTCLRVNIQRLVCLPPPLGETKPRSCVRVCSEWGLLLRSERAAKATGSSRC